MLKPLNIIVGNAKRFMAYDIIGRLEKMRETFLLEELYGFVKKREKKKGQIHRVFEESFDACPCYTRKFIQQKLDYIHKNPVSKKWQLVKDYRDWPHSSAGFYEGGSYRYDKLLHVGEVW
jgi:hypothetical protein